jgi:hypothetical protein
VKTLTGIAVVLGLMLAPATAGAQLPVGEAHGVRVVRERGAIVVIFTDRAAKLYKRIAGKLVSVSCTEIAEDGSNTGEVTVRAPLHGRKLATGDLTRGMDYCRVWRPRHTIRRHGQKIDVSRRVIVSVPLTQQGAVFLDEESKTQEMFSIDIVAGVVQERQKLKGHPTYDQIIKEFPQLARAVAPLAAPGDSPPPGKVGYYSDGLEHVAVVAISASGRRLFIEAAADDVFSTNVLQYLFNEQE